jgi:hypothetical protein
MQVSAEAQSAPERRRRLLRREVVEPVAGRGAADVVLADDVVVSGILGLRSGFIGHGSPERGSLETLSMARPEPGRLGTVTCLWRRWTTSADERRVLREAAAALVVHPLHRHLENPAGFPHCPQPRRRRIQFEERRSPSGRVQA